MTKLTKLSGLAALGTALAALPAWAQDAAAQGVASATSDTGTLVPYVYETVVDKGDVAWMTTSAALVLLMTIPGLALFYGGLVRTKNMLSMLTQVLAITSVVAIIWVTYGYSLAFTDGGAWNSFVGGFDKAFLRGVDLSTVAATFSNGIYLPEYTYVAFQMTFACITPALIVGSFAERFKFSSLLVFVVLWVTFVYFPMAHMVWWWGGPDFLAQEQTALLIAQGAGDTAAADTASANLAANGLIFNWGALDFAGGTVVHINAGIAGLVGCLLLGRRVGYGRENFAPHSLTMTMIGAALLWVGWFGFNAGSNLEANSVTALAFINTFVAAAAAGMAWLFAEWILKGHPSLLGLASGVVAGLVAITPASGFAGPMGSIVLGIVASLGCFVFVAYAKNALRLDDSLDVFGIHCLGGIIGAIGTGILVNPALGGTGIPDYLSQPGTLQVGAYDMAFQVTAQVKAVLLTLAWSGIGSFILYTVINVVMGLRVTQDTEREGLDLAEHGEPAYNM
ncbi:Ammonium transporter [Rubellimicrobium mesophilum DSM 19309]|uniref:Ammonium transporter n=1 Tax=Rubellimicrobium mesophilum DSM 19309 TaxID=442562 RepID=A0A017HW11_9RHOB|nr:ammonium transporter [Rubellimicrobium mesophilum]EYD78363.1 Ammonium transporter [Rubellimicrobium mesophilum DSM 19309]